MGTLMRKTEPHQKWSSSTPPVIGPIAMAEADAARPDADGLGLLVALEDVHQDGEGGGHHEGGAEAHHARGRR